MALFSMIRYTGEEDKHEEDKGKKAIDILTQLNEQAVKRKRDQGIEDEAEAGDKPKKKKKKEKKVEEEPTVDGQKRKKKKEIADDEIEKDEDSKGKRKKKTKKQMIEQETEKAESSEEETKKEQEENEEEELADEEEGMEEEDNSEDGEEDDEDESQQQSKKTVGGFTVIGDVKKKKQEKVTRVLPDWLTKTTSISSNLKTDRTSLENIPAIHDRLVKLLEKNGINDLFPVQARLIPSIMKSFDERFPYALTKGGYRPSDLCCSAATGSGKTLAYVLPIVQALSRRVVPAIRALVVLPVRDLAQQVFKVFSTYCSGTNLKVVLTAGYKTFENEQHQLTHGPGKSSCSADIVVTTPGRLVDHLIETQGFCLNDLRFLVIDEADRLMKEFKFDWVSKVENAVYFQNKDTQSQAKNRYALNVSSVSGSGQFKIPLQKLLFSATLSQNPEVLQQMRLYQPRLFTAAGRLIKPDVNGHSIDDKEPPQDSITKYVTPDNLNEMLIKCDENTKPLVLLYLLHTQKYRHVLCFTNSVKSTHRLTTLLRLMGKVSVDEISSKVSQNKRKKIIKKFAAGKIDVLVCSDQMARGMDIENARCVISYDAPNFIQNYVHRVGRTARGGHAGSAITLLLHSQVKFFKEMIEKAGKSEIRMMPVKQCDLETFVDAYEEALREMPAVLEKEKKL